MTFNPSDHLTKLKGKDYLEVKYRIQWFRSEHPGGTIKTEHIEISEDHAIFRATVFVETDGGFATGYGSETKKDFGDFIEKAETKSVGRALAALGFGTQFAPELDEGERIVDSPVQRAPQADQQPRSAPQPNPQVSPEEDRRRARAAWHIALKQAGASDDDKAAWYASQGVTSSNDVNVETLGGWSRSFRDRPTEGMAYIARWKASQEAPAAPESNDAPEDDESPAHDIDGATQGGLAIDISPEEEAEYRRSANYTN